MYIKRNYGFWMTFSWSKKPFILGFIYAFVITAAFAVCKALWSIELVLPWQPISVLGIAVAFYLGFKNNSSYDRTWEARKIWGGIVNNSRTFGAAVKSFVQNEDANEVQRQLIYRHIAWLIALRHQLRLARDWEHTDERAKDMFSVGLDQDLHERLRTEMKPLLTEGEIEKLLTKTNVATQILHNQSEVLQSLRDKEYFEDFRHMEFHSLIRSFYEDQGKSERIKNFPFPRQYASVALWQTYIFAALIPFGMLNIFGQMQSSYLWLNAPLSGLIIWVFFLMEMIGDYSENPFEGTYNDVPISNISRAIEIDLREMLDEEDIPPAVAAKDGFLM